MIDKNWTRWIHVSIHKHFFDAMQIEGVPFFIEGQHRETRDDKTLVELRISGPEYHEASKDYFNVTLGVNLLLQFALDDSNYHGMLQLQGQVLQYVTSMQILQYGDITLDPANDSSLLGCLHLEDESIDVYQLGQIEKSTKLIQAMIAAEYRMCLEP